jgi:hypothetical protein
MEFTKVTQREMRNVHKFVVGKPEGKVPLGRLRRRWKDNIKMDVKEMELEVVGWIRLVQDRKKWWAVVNMVMDFRFHKRRGIS